MSDAPLKTEGVDISPGAVEWRAEQFAAGSETARMLRALRAALTASERHLAVANKLWRLCVDEDWPWADGSTQDDLANLGLLVATDMRADDSPEECTNCDGDCSTCFRAVKRIEDVAMEKADD